MTSIFDVKKSASYGIKIANRTPRHNNMNGLPSNQTLKETRRQLFYSEATLELLSVFSRFDTNARTIKHTRYEKYQRTIPTT